MNSHDLCRRHSRVYYSRHPNVDHGDEEVLQFLSGFANVDIGACPAYSLFANQRVEEIMTISSSAAVEAKYFDKDVTILHRRVIQLGAGLEREEYRSIYHDFLSPHFWSAVLAPLTPTNPTPKVAFLDRKDKLRDMLNWFHNYRILDKVEQMRAPARTDAGPARKAHVSHRSAILQCRGAQGLP